MDKVSRGSNLQAARSVKDKERTGLASRDSAGETVAHSTRRARCKSGARPEVWLELNERARSERAGALGASKRCVSRNPTTTAASSIMCVVVILDVAKCRQTQKGPSVWHGMGPRGSHLQATSIW